MPLTKLLCIVTCLAFILATASAAQYSGSFTLVGIQNNGVMKGRFEYDWDALALRFSFTSNGYVELFSFNPTRGVTGDYTKQYVYQSAASGVCGNCQTSPLKSSMPLLFSAAPAGFNRDGSATINGNNCEVWRTTSANPDTDEPTVIHIDPSNSFPCAITYRSGRQYIFSGLASASGITFTPPTNCQCRKRLDINMLLDSSGSIDNNEWNQINTWVRNLANSFTFGPDNAAMSISSFSSRAHVLMPLTDDKAKIDLTLRSTLSKDSGGTNVIGGIENVRVNVFPNLRQNAIPLLITMTDGADESSATAIANKINTLKVAPYNIKNFVSIFIGSGTTTRAQMISLAGGDASRTYQYNDFSSFQRAVGEIVAAACDSDVKDADCGTGCCGFCMCTTCVTPDDCDDGLKCTNQALVNTGTAGLQCCNAPSAVVCNAPDLCTISSCNPADGQCLNAAKDCNNGNLCSAISCDPTLGCQVAEKCTSNDKCQIPSCNPADGACSLTPKQCPANDQCHTYTCTSPTGDCALTLKNCDDGNPCTADSCDDATGCVHVPQDCNCTCPEPATLCEAKDCRQGQCITTSKCLTSPDPCYTYTGKCDTVNGCEKVAVCKDNDPCTEDICNAGVCDFKPIVCNDQNECTTDSCVNGNCVFAAVSCPDQDKCHTGSCNSSIGCVQTPIDLSKCDDFNVCTNDTCNPSTGCEHTLGALNCDDGRPCTIDSCDPQLGCVSKLKSCPNKPKCSIGTCTNGTCTLYKPPLCKEEILAVGLSAGAIAGIVLAVIIAAALGAFGAFKGYQAYNANKDLDDSGMNNPLYEQGGTYGQNQLFGDYAAFQPKA